MSEKLDYSSPKFWTAKNTIQAIYHKASQHFANVVTSFYILQNILISVSSITRTTLDFINSEIYFPADKIGDNPTLEITYDGY
ncbi:hypothetical protein V6C17_01025 [Dendrosporobacter sp. 1207_IL3150]